MKTPPRQDKIEDHMNYYRKYGKFKKPIIITQSGMLLDGFIDYLIASNLGIEFNIHSPELEIKFYEEETDSEEA